MPHIRELNDGMQQKGAPPAWRGRCCHKIKCRYHKIYAMNKGRYKIFNLSILLCLCATTYAQDTVRYTGNTLVNVDYHHGQ
jgi:hypothetical protein